MGVRREALDALLSKEEAVKKQAEWSDLTILFMTDHDVQVRFADAKAENFSYADMGFADGRKGGTTKAWDTLREFAERDKGEPTLARIEVSFAERANLESRMKEIRQNLRGFLRKHYPNYSIPKDSYPTPHHMNKRTKTGYYETTFKVGLAPQLRSSEK